MECQPWREEGDIKVWRLKFLKESLNLKEDKRDGRSRDEVHQQQEGLMQSLCQSLVENHYRQTLPESLLKLYTIELINTARGNKNLPHLFKKQ